MTVDSHEPAPTESTNQMVDTHPGRILLDHFLVPCGLTPSQLANRTSMTRSRIREIVLGRRSVSADTALRLARFFGTSPEFWLTLQASHDITKSKLKSGMDIAEIEPLSPFLSAESEPFTD